MGLREFLSRIFRHKKPKAVPKVVILDNNPLSIASYLEEHGDKVQRLRVSPSDELFWRRKPILVKRPGSQAAHKDIGKFMQHGRQLPNYRKTVKQHVDPED